MEFLEKTKPKGEEFEKCRELNVVGEWQIIKLSQVGSGPISVIGVGNDKSERLGHKVSSKDAWGILGTLKNVDGIEIEPNHFHDLNIGDGEHFRRINEARKILVQKLGSRYTFLREPQSEYRYLVGKSGFKGIEYKFKIPLRWID